MTEKETLNFYESIYIKNNPTLDVADCGWKYDQMRNFLKFDDKPGSILDVGCGSGVLLNMIRSELNPFFSSGV